MKTRDEFELIADYLTGLDHGPAVALGVGDDAAVLDLGRDEQLVVSTDVAVAGVHFPIDAPLDRAAFRAVAAAASDLVAMAARPLAMTLNLSLASAQASELAALRRGLEAATAAFELPLVGGDLVRAPLSLGVQVLGAVRRGAALTRSGAQPGDRLCVSGCLGDSAAGLALLQGRPVERLAAAMEERLIERFWQPRPDFVLGRSLAGVATAAIDVSDGLLADAAHLARASGVGLEIDSARLPLSIELRACADREQVLDWALAGGEDYVLCFTLAEAAPLPAGCSVIGAVTAGEGVHCDREPRTATGYRHF
ncbi:MAG: thiamine-phosphate kinase [Halieaceae bacterium]|jgi:thiamine-monophosphate kinase|nr:thiamine-phosphate kinase [Halieaceae bacterium]